MGIRLGIKGAVEFASETSLSHLRAVAQLQFDQLAELRTAHAAEIEQRAALTEEIAVQTRPGAS